MRTLCFALLMICLVAVPAGAQLTVPVFSIGSANDTAYNTISLASTVNALSTVQIWHDGGSADTLMVLFGTDTTKTPFYLIDADLPLVMKDVKVKTVRLKAKKSGTLAEYRLLGY